MADQVRTALVNSYQPAYENVIAWLSRDLDNTDPEPVESGRYLKALITITSCCPISTTDFTAEEIHQIGLDEVERLTTEMEAVKEEVGFEGDMPAFLDAVSSGLTVLLSQH